MILERLKRSGHRIVIEIFILIMIFHYFGIWSLLLSIVIGFLEQPYVTKFDLFLNPYLKNIINGKTRN